MPGMENSSINGYVLKYKLGEGGICEVWYAENYLLKPAAVKVLHEQFSRMPAIVSAFEREAQILGRLAHPNICKGYDWGQLNGRAAMVMEFLEGKDFARHLAENTFFTNTQLIGWWNQAVDALRYIHQHNIVHRDIKPGNIFLMPSGEIKLFDFGIASSLQEDEQEQTKIQAGSQLYMSPEQVYQRKDISAKTDVYALATTFYHLVTRKKPYGADGLSDFEVQESIVRKNIDVSLLPEPWRTVLPPCLHKEPGPRSYLQPIGQPTSIPDKDQAAAKTASNNGTAPATKMVNLRTPLRKKLIRPGCLLFYVFIIVSLLIVASFVNRIKPYIKEIISWGNVITNSGEEKNKPVKGKQTVKKPVPKATMPAPANDQNIQQEEPGLNTPFIPDQETRETQLKEFVDSYYKLRGNCDNLRMFFADRIMQYYSMSNISIADAEAECDRYHGKWRITRAEIDSSSYVITHEPDGSSFVDFNMLYRIKTGESQPWTEYSIDVSMLIGIDDKITRIVERRIEKL